MHRDRLELSLLRRVFRRTERPAVPPTCNGCALVADAGAALSAVQRRRRSRANGASLMSPATATRSTRSSSQNAEPRRYRCLLQRC